MTNLQTPLQVELSAVERARAALAQTLGVEEQAIRLTDRRWLELLGEGVIGSVHVGHWTARARLVAGDLGLPVAAYLPWKGRMLENNGIVPKFSIELSREALKQGRDTQLGTAIEVVRAL